MVFIDKNFFSLICHYVQVPFCKSDQSSGFTGNLVNNISGVAIDCKNAVGYMAVYRICFAMFMFFVLMAFIMMGVKNSRDGRASIQNGCLIFF